VMVSGQLFDFFKEWERWYISQQGIWFLKASNRITLLDPNSRMRLVWKFFKSPMKCGEGILYQCEASMNFGNKHPIPAGMLKSRYPRITGYIGFNQFQVVLIFLNEPPVLGVWK
jgi:hypothetical protein